MIKNASLKAHILLPLALVLAILLGAFHYSLYQHEKNNADREFVHQLQAAKNYYDRALTGRSEKLGVGLEAILRDKPLQVALRAHDRKALLKRSAPLFKALHDQYGITHFYFEDTARVNVLRVHQPERYGDTINRYTTLTAEKTGKITSGVELGPIGTFTLRVVAPIYDSHGLIGYVELGEEIEGVLQGLHDIIGTDLALFIDKQFLVRKNWESGMRMLKRNADWDRLPDAAIIHQTLDLPREVLLRLLSGRDQPDSITNLNLGNKHYHVGMIPVEDATGRKVGSLFMLQDMSLKFREMAATLRNLSLFYLALGGTLFALFALIIHRVERRLEHSRQQAITQGEEHVALQAKHIAELQDEQDRLQRAQKELQQSQGKLRLSAQVFENSTEGIVITDIHANILQINRAFATITGYSEEEVTGKNINILHSGRHGPNFYQAMWSSLVEFGYWQGEIWNRRKNGEIYPEWLTLIATRDEQGEIIHYIGVFADLTEKKQTEARAHYFANYDTNTDLPNRLLLAKHLQQELERANGNGWQVALLYLDLDRFKTINDTLGHRIGDKLLKAVAERIGHMVRDIDIIGRLSSDEFTIVLSDVGNRQNAEQVAKKILDAMNQPFEMEGQEVFITPSIGIALYPQDANSHEDLIRNADTAMAHIKAQGGNGFHFYSADMNVASSQRLTMETQLRRALERNEFVLYYQPQLSLHSGRIIGMEALLRWQHPERGLVSPAEFIPLLEETGMIVAVGDWVLHTACAQNSAWMAAGLPPLRMAVNLSARQFRQRDLIESVNQALQNTGLAPEHLELEITESIMIQDLQTTITTLNQLHALGIQISIDDFGTGYSSLSYLKRLPISKIKIDQSFIRDICTDLDDEAIANAVISLGHSLKMQVIAEGVETLEQLEHLRKQKCDEIQGYYFSRPLPAEAFAQLVRKSLITVKPV
ncbi:MAG: EAL domain-containing protein [Gammaproteobacteria bacterium]|nr:EAL domain-containing protein [Gammaproteobacteria bacterium]MBU1980298.1 EAL domain-containing protein [Gammaproteobacteria bacterium]